MKNYPECFRDHNSLKKILKIMKNKFYLLRVALLIATFHFSLFTFHLQAQNVSVSPSRFYFKAAPGETKKQVLHVTNSSPNRQSFNISFGDFASPGTSGKTIMMKPGESEHS